MIPDRYDPMAARPVVRAPGAARPAGRTLQRGPSRLTSLAAAGLALIVFTLSLVVLTALLLPGAR